MDVKASIDFTVFGGKQLENFRQLIPSCPDYYRDTNEYPTIQYDSEAKCENIEIADGKSVVVELSDHSATVVSCNDDIELGLMWTTKRSNALDKLLADRDARTVVALQCVTRGATITWVKRQCTCQILRRPQLHSYLSGGEFPDLSCSTLEAHRGERCCKICCGVLND